MKIVQDNNAIGYWKGQGSKKSFHKLTNFGLRLMKHVRAPKELPQYSGFMVQVSQKQRCRNSEDGDRTTVVKG